VPDLGFRLPLRKTFLPCGYHLCRSMDKGARCLRGVWSLSRKHNNSARMPFYIRFKAYHGWKWRWRLESNVKKVYRAHFGASMDPTFSISTLKRVVPVWPLRAYNQPRTRSISASKVDPGAWPAYLDRQAGLHPAP
jgi:hypothetical protein